jgi:hypothetical protein
MILIHKKYHRNVEMYGILGKQDRNDMQKQESDRCLIFNFDILLQKSVVFVQAGI